jgi:putative SOS response-associated peptidase YedK
VVWGTGEPLGGTGFDALMIVCDEPADYQRLSCRFHQLGICHPSEEHIDLLAPREANARAETAADTPAFRDPFRYGRCLVPADRFFGWKTIGKKKLPYFVRPSGGGLFVYVGVWDRWDGPEGPLETVAVLTVPANDLIKTLHDRMPAILGSDHFAVWLDPKETRSAKLLPLLTPYPAERMEMYPVSDRVNRVSADDPELLTPVAEPPKPKWTQPSLFDDAA